ncbi:Lar family restriction alleviation protein [Olsenella sp. An293]|uniref:Lar family restriction alleviation protein n=1 Tax=Olsenella sp. An293 TaxID=1965626 RepID=UPI000B37C430|nr:Lar family restriction alleviation protein [Olsenella sp. An293]OUO32268.1 hypothetical protein B5F85_06960 [Olsenella sp. An293]
MSYLAKTPEGLLPCPHCGGEAEARDGSSTTPYIRCKSCGCRTGSSHDIDRLKAAWNRRVESTCHYVYDKEICAWRCSECGGLEPVGDHVRYCPDCGARIEDEVGE